LSCLPESDEIIFGGALLDDFEKVFQEALRDDRGTSS
jgi:hypothetical protein